MKPLWKYPDSERFDMKIYSVFIEGLGLWLQMERFSAFLEYGQSEQLRENRLVSIMGVITERQIDL